MATKRPNNIQVSALEIQQLIMWKFPESKSLTDGAYAAAMKYDLSPETMLCYAYQGISNKSKAYKVMSSDIEDMRRYEESAWRLIDQSQSDLVAAIDANIAAFKQAAEHFSNMKKEILNRKVRG
jgi:hypothetical protein